MNEGRLAGQVAWVSGGASGIGEAIAELFAAEGASVTIADIQHEQGEAVAVERIRQAGARRVSCLTMLRSPIRSRPASKRRLPSLVRCKRS